jgi:hypothetical protein
MKTTVRVISRRSQDGYALLVVMGFFLVGALMLAGILSWCSNQAVQVEWNNQYNQSLAAAEAATEKVLSHISKDFQNGDGESTVFSHLSSYQTMIPSAEESEYWSGYRFGNTEGQVNQTLVGRVNPEQQMIMNSQYQGLYGLAATYQVSSQARSFNKLADVGAAVRQTVQVATIPIFQFAIFYSVDLEIHPGANMDVTGRVHSNSKLFTTPNSGVTLTYKSHVTSADALLIYAKKDGDLRNLSNHGTAIFNAEKDANVSSLTLPIGTSNSPDDVYKILEVPPAGEPALSLLGQQRYYNKADVVVVVEDGGIITAKTGAYNSFTQMFRGTNVASFVRSDKTFYNGREDKTVRATQIDVAAFKTWAEAANPVKSSKGGSYIPNSIYVVDKRTQDAGTESGVRLINGEQLPGQGLTVATPNPLYVQGNYNIKDSSGTSSGSNTTHTKPASLVGDAITILSPTWTDSANATKSLGNNHTASDTTVNAALLGGIVETKVRAGGLEGYSGGVENFPRFLENWSNKTITYNGSMVVMFYSKKATGFWSGTGSYYTPPKRSWAFDINFLDATKLPPGTPKIRSMIRGEWATLGASH